MPPDVALTVAQLDVLHQIVDSGPSGVAISNRRTDHTVTRQSVTGLARRGLVETDETKPAHAFATDLGRTCIAANADHLPPSLHELPAYRRGRQQAIELRRHSVTELEAHVAFLEHDHPERQAERNLSLWMLDHFREVERIEATQQQEATT